MPPPTKDLNKLAQDLLANGPVKALPAAPKRIRIQLGGRTVADTTTAQYVWEHPYYPTYYVPVDAFAKGSLAYPTAAVDDGETRGYAIARLSSCGDGGPFTERVIVFLPRSAKGEGSEEQKGRDTLAGLVRVEFSAAEAWFEEDARIDIHPKDPFKRVDVVFSSRPVRILVHGEEVACARGGAFHLYETGLPVRFYLPPTCVRWGVLRESRSVTGCPYKGEANYYDVVVGEEEGEVLRDGVWYYKNPKMECAAIAGCLCFYNEKVDVELDGKMLERPKSLFA